MDITRLAVSKTSINGARFGRKVGMILNLLKPGLRGKLLLLTIGVSLILVLLYAFLLYGFQRQQLRDNARTTTMALSSTIEANLHHALMANNWEMVEDIINAVGSEDTFETVRIIDAQGGVIAASAPNEVGVRFEQSQPACQLCHAKQNPSSSETVFFTSDDGHQVLLNVNLIHNQPECRNCHPSEQRILGLLMIETPLTHLNEKLSHGFRRTLLLSTGIFGLAIGLMLPVLNHYVIRPVSKLSKGVSEISAGNLDFPVEPLNPDELGKLAQSFNYMRQQLKNMVDEMERREQESTTLYGLGTKISSSLALQEVLDGVAEAAQELLAADIGLIGLLDEDRPEVIMRAGAGIKKAKLKLIGIPVSKQDAGYALVEGKPVMLEVCESNHTELCDGNIIAEENIRSLLAVPLRLGDNFLGVIEVMTRQPRRFVERDAQLLTRLAHHVVVSIENARLYRQLRYLAVLEERDRLAREMHDHLSQALGYLNIKASMIDDLLSGRDVDQAHESLVELKKVINVAYIDVREAIFNLRTRPSSGVGLLSALKNYLADYQAHYGVHTELIADSSDFSQSVELPPEVASQLLRIVQEALTNVRKHTDENKALIRCSRSNGQVCITIEDEGGGFNPTHIAEKSHKSFGLQIMRERAESVGGSLELETQTGCGTRVIVRVPAKL